MRCAPKIVRIGRQSTWCYCAAWLVGCVPSVYGRTADIAPPGRVAVALSDAVATLGTVHVRGVTVDGRGVSLSEPKPFRVKGDLGLLLAGWLVSLEVQPQVGVIDPCEISPMFTFFRLGTEVRCAALREAGGAPLSLSVSLAGGYADDLLKKLTRFDETRRGAWGRVGLDVSRWLNHVAPVFNAYMTYGPELYSFGSDEFTAFDDNGNAPSIFIARDELRLGLALGLAVGRPHTKEQRAHHLVISLVETLVLDGNNTKVVDRDKNAEGFQLQSFSANAFTGLALRWVL